MDSNNLILPNNESIVFNFFNIRHRIINKHDDLFCFFNICLCIMSKLFSLMAIMFRHPNKKNRYHTIMKHIRNAQRIEINENMKFQFFGHLPVIAKITQNCQFFTFSIFSFSAIRNRIRVKSGYPDRIRVNRRFTRIHNTIKSVRVNRRFTRIRPGTRVVRVRDFPGISFVYIFRIL